MELTPLDYKLLEFISRKQPVMMPDIRANFSSNMANVEYRLQILRTQKYSQNSPVENSNFIFEDEIHTIDEDGITQAEGTGKLFLTEMGQKSLEDYKLSKKEASKKLISPLNILGAILVLVIPILASLYLNELRAWIDRAVWGLLN